MTNATAPATDPRIAVYLARLDAAVGRLPHAEACDLVREIQVHISDKLEGHSVDSEVERVLAGLGSPEELAPRLKSRFPLNRNWLRPRGSVRRSQKNKKIFVLGIKRLAPLPLRSLGTENRVYAHNAPSAVGSVGIVRLFGNCSW